VREGLALALSGWGNFPSQERKGEVPDSNCTGSVQYKVFPSETSKLTRGPEARPRSVRETPVTPARRRHTDPFFSHPPHSLLSNGGADRRARALVAGWVLASWPGLGRRPHLMHTCPSATPPPPAGPRCAEAALLKETTPEWEEAAREREVAVLAACEALPPAAWPAPAAPGDAHFRRPLPALCALLHRRLGRSSSEDACLLRLLLRAGAESGNIWRTLEAAEWLPRLGLALSRSGPAAAAAAARVLTELCAVQELARAETALLERLVLPPLLCALDEAPGAAPIAAALVAACRQLELKAPGASPVASPQLAAGGLTAPPEGGSPLTRLLARNPTVGHTLITRLNAPVDGEDEAHSAYICRHILLWLPDHFYGNDLRVLLSVLLRELQRCEGRASDAADSAWSAMGAPGRQQGLLQLLAALLLGPSPASTPGGAAADGSGAGGGAGPPLLELSDFQRRELAAILERLEGCGARQPLPASQELGRPRSLIGGGGGVGADGSVRASIQGLWGLLAS
jgi:hypothetical protein